MKTIIFLFILITSVSFAQTTTTPSPALAEGAVTINFNKTGTPLATTTAIYAHIGATVNGTRWSNSKGTWGTTNAPLLTLVSGTTYKLDLTSDLYTYFGVPLTSSITEICVVFRNATGTIQTSPDIFLNVGAFQATLTSPVSNSNNIISSGSSLLISANNIGGNADYNLLANGTSINTFTGTSYSYNDANIVANKNYDLQITQGATSFSKKFSVIVNPNSVSEAMPIGLVDGINYTAGDATKATLVLDAPGKDFVYVAGSFNNWQPDATYVMKKDVSSTKFWIVLTGLVSGTNYTYQYWVVDQTPTAGSPTLVKTADPYSTLVLNKEEDPYIPAGNYPNLPAYPAGQDREVTVLKTGQTPYAWSTATTNFVKPEKDNLVVYEVLVRDFDANRSYQNLIDRIDYFKNLKVNAIELMPVMEFDGNESWGYNTSFHMALDKAYGPSAKLKEFIDLCHQNGIAVILDVALNHAFGRSPMDRMWMNDPDGDGWGGPATDNPYFNVTAMHSYNVGNDFNHQQARTQYFVKRVIKQWIQEYKIDGFRWDLTKGFTQNCPSNVAGGQDVCTNAYQADRVAILKEYADYSWSLDPTHYTIFEHLGTDNEEQQWANYRIGETPSKGVMLWGKMTDEYSQLTMGYNSSNNISRMNSSNRGFTGKRLMGYAESHDEERLMYKNLQYGANFNGYNVKTLSTALNRMSALGAVTLLVPGPKMIWHFGEMGWDPSIYTCNNGIVNDSSATLAGDCKLDTKPQLQWASNWLGNADRNKIYTEWAKMISLKINQPVFSGTATMASVTTLTPNIKITNGALLPSQLKDVLILANFGLSTQNVATGFPYTGTWYNLMDNTSIDVADVNATISIPAGDYRIYGNKTPVIVQNYTYYADADGDSYGTGSAIQLQASTAPAGYSVNNTDCDDTHASVNPGAIEIFDALDNNCDGSIDEGTVLGAPTANNTSVCLKTVAARPSATALAGYTLNWYTTATKGTAVTVAPTVVTTAAKVIKYYVSQKLGSGIESARTLVTVTVNALAATPTKLALTNGSAAAVTTVGAFVGAAKALTLTATAVGASSYDWTLPAGVVRTDATGSDIDSCLTSTSSAIYVKFTESNSTTAIVVGVSSVNANGCSSVAKTLSLKRALPTVVSKVTGSTKVCDRSQGFTYTITPNATATKYLITAPEGSVVTSTNGVSGTTANILTTSDLTFKVVYGASGTSLTVQSINGTGNGATKTLTLKRVACSTLTTVSKVAPVANLFKVVAYPNPSKEGFTIKSSNERPFGVQVYDMLGRSIEQRQLKSGSQIGSNYARGIYSVIVTQDANVKILRVIKK